MVEPSSSEGRRAAIVESSTAVFLRFGFKKTSMDDLARAAGLSRQGLYLYFSTKEALFQEVVTTLIASAKAAASVALGREDLDIEERLLRAFLALHHELVARGGADATDELLRAAKELVGTAFEDMEQAFLGDLVRVLRSSGIAARWKEAGVSAKELAEHLHAVSVGAKHGVSPTAYQERMKVALRIVCRGAPG